MRPVPKPSALAEGATQPERDLVLLVAECRWGRLGKVTLELLGEARQIAAAAGGRVELVLLASPSTAAAALSDLQMYAVERLHLVEDPALEDYSTDTYLQALEPLLASMRPNIVLIPATAYGRDFAPRVAARLGIGYLPHCLTVRPGTGRRFQITRVTHGGRVHVQAVWPLQAPVILTMKPGVADAPDARPTPGNLPVERHVVDLRPGRTRVVERMIADPATQDIREAERIVAGGRGVGGADGFAVLRGLASELGASVGASRVAVDLGWIEHGRQVGQTGKTVAPRLYIAAGISGAGHHVTGMRNSEKIVALNTDRQAPIFSLSHFGVVGNLHQVVPQLTALIRQHKASIGDSEKKQGRR